MSTSRNTSLGVLIPFWVITLGAIILVLLSTVGSFSTYAYLKDETFITENVEYSYNYQAYLSVALHYFLTPQYTRVLIIRK